MDWGKKDGGTGRLWKHSGKDWVWAVAGECRGGIRKEGAGDRDWLGMKSKGGHVAWNNTEVSHLHVWLYYANREKKSGRMRQLEGKIFCFRCFEFEVLMEVPIGCWKYLMRGWKTLVFRNAVIFLEMCILIISPRKNMEKREESKKGRRSRRQQEMLLDATVRPRASLWEVTVEWCQRKAGVVNGCGEKVSGRFYI